jgi:ATP-dependent DNA helicase RecG
MEAGVLERIGGGKFILSRQYYEFAGQPGAYTRKRGLDRETNKALLLKHITDNAATGSRLSDLMQVLPALSRRQVQWLLSELRKESRVHAVGPTRASLWYPGPE